MIVVRDELRIAPEGMKNAKEIAKEMTKLEVRGGASPARLMCDLIGEYYTLVIETELQDLAAYGPWLTNLLADEAWQKSYGRLRPYVRGGTRTVYTVL